MVVGLPTPWEEEYNRNCAGKHHFRRERIAGCLISPWDEAYIAGYNSVSIPAIEAKRSKRMLAVAMRESIEEYMRTRNPDDEMKGCCNLVLSHLKLP